MNKKINFNKPYITREEKINIKKSIKLNKYSGDGYFTKKVSDFIEETFSAKKALLTTSCSSALDLSLLILDIGPGDEVILPSFTFVSTANSVLLRGATCVFAEVDEFLNIDIHDVEKKITEKTKVIIPVHYASTSCDMDRLKILAKENNIVIVEDAAQAVNAKYKDKYLGTIGEIGCYSFHETKNYMCGEGGALLINSDNKELIQKAEIAREKGTNRSQFYRGEVDKYSWKSIGSSFLPSDLLASVLYGQFKKLNKITKMREKNFYLYKNLLLDLENKGYLNIIKVPSYNKPNYHIFYILLKNEKTRNSLMDFLRENNIQAVFHYLPLHSSDMGIKLGYKKDDLPFTQEISERLLRLPLFPELKNQEIIYICNKINDFFLIKE
jgi:dTDP-4-amino-4,6-dideoxygalactose transaminase